MENYLKSAASRTSLVHSLISTFLLDRLKQEGFRDFSSSHGNILFQLNICPKMTMTELSNRINRDKSTTTVLVRKLKTLNFLEEEYSTTDKRTKYIMLTKKGKEYNKVTNEISNELLETFYKNFTEEEKVTLYNLLDKVINNFQKE